jgi:hypothetical protein
MTMNTPKTETTTRHSKGGCCEESECGSGVRNNYFLNKRLTPDSFRVEQRYTLDRRRLLNRAIHGWGVVYGFKIATSQGDPKQPAEKLSIGVGLALDRCGRELVRESEGWLKIDDDLIVLNEKFRNTKTEERSRIFEEAVRGNSCWRLSVHYAERSVGPVKIDDSCHCSHEEWDRTCETVRFSLQKISCDECCDSFTCELECGCGRCCDDKDDKGDKDDKDRPADDKKPDIRYQGRDTGRTEPITIFEDFSSDSDREEDRPKPAEPRSDTDREEDRLKPSEPRSLKRAGCRCLCEHLTNLDLSAECEHLCEIEEECGNVRVDLANGVPLACVRIVKGECGWSFAREIEDCGPRRLVKRNDLLFDLIRGCDLTYIEHIGWWRWHRKSDPIDFDKFLKAFGSDFDADGNCITRAFWVKFSRPVRWDTVRRDCFVMTIVTDERDDGWWETLRVPIVRIEKADTEMIDEATIVVDGRWLREVEASGDAVKGAYSLFQDKITRVELEVRGDFIVDCNGQTVDANPKGNSPFPTGNGTPGGSFLSTFLVGPAPSRSRPLSSYSEDRIKGVS